MVDFVKVGKISEVKKGEMKRFEVGGQKILVTNIGGKFYATNEKCTHVGGPLAEGKIDNGVVTCPWHGSQFDLKTGEVTHGPAKEPLKTFEVKAEGEDLLVKV